MGFFVGLKLDGWLGSVPWLTILGAFAGAGAGFYTLYIRLLVEPSSLEGRLEENGE
ncbi:MAG: AtpZ/AtpI family protein [Longimicrobiales bacterium]